MDVLMTVSLPTTVLVSATTCICEGQHGGGGGATMSAEKHVEGTWTKSSFDQVESLPTALSKTVFISRAYKSHHTHPEGLDCGAWEIGGGARMRPGAHHLQLLLHVLRGGPKAVNYFFDLFINTRSFQGSVCFSSGKKK